MLTLSNLTKSYGAQPLFRDANLQLHPGYRYGVVGANGSGKSTLLRIIAGDEDPSAGDVQVPRKARVGVLRQDHFRYEDVPILHVVMMGNRELWDAMEEKEAILARAHEYFDADRYSELEDVVLQYDGYALEARAGEILEGLNIPSEVHHEPLSTLSGGFKLRALLGQVLASEPDVLLLDEPTNHLDILSIRWLEKFLADYQGCAMVISHDHRFLDNVCTHVIDVDYEQVTLYSGNYSAFEEQKAADRERLEAEIAKREKEIADQKAFIERFKAKATKARQAQSRVKRVEKMEIRELPRSSRRHPAFRFTSRRPSGKEVLSVEGVSKAYDDNQVLDGVSFTVERGDRMAVIGPNGIGKSTLLKIAVGALEADDGEIEWGYEAHPGYFAQDHREILGGEEQTVQGWLWETCPGEPIGFVRSHLARVLFTKDEVDKKLSSLSGGEAARLVFSRLSVTKPNVLVLDEPTNHLDLEGIEALADALADYDGTILFVSHDRWFVSRLATRVLEITPDGIQDFRGSYEEYLERCGDDHLDAEVAAQQARLAKAAAG
ncbi:MAG: ABC-F family ATP-binding cassette domain-containing protein [Myxococcota bacterium]